MLVTVLLILLAVAILAFFLGRQRAVSLAKNSRQSLHSRPIYHGGYFSILSAVPAILVAIIWSPLSTWYVNGATAQQFSEKLAELGKAEIEAFLRDAQAIAFDGIVGFRDETREAAAIYLSTQQATMDWLLMVVCLFLAIAGFAYAWKTSSLTARTRHHVERFVMAVLIACSAVAILTTVGIVLSLIFETIRFFGKVPLFDFLFGMNWSPQGAFQSANSTGEMSREELGAIFGAVPLFAGTLLITVIAILVAAPIGLMSAIYLSDYATVRVRTVAKPLLEILAGVPTVVYGFFAALTVAPAIRGWGESIGLDVSSESALAAGLVMGIMIIPFVSSLSDDVINAVPQSLRDGSFGLGATKSETIRKVILPAALPGIVSAILLAISRAIGETMIVVMAAGLAANLTINPLEAVTTVTVQIVTLLVGDQEFDSAKTLAAFALGLVLFCITLTLNIIALRVVRKYKEQYD